MATPGRRDPDRTPPTGRLTVTTGFASFSRRENPRVTSSEPDVQTFLLTDVEGSTRLWEDYPEATGLALARHDEIAATVASEFSGRIVKPRGEGDSAFIVFPSTADAVAAALRLQQSLLMERWPGGISLRVRMALHCGAAEYRDNDFYGSTVNRCARLRGAAHGGQVLLSDAVVQQTADQLPLGASVSDLGVHRLRDLQQPERIWQLTHPTLDAHFPALVTLGVPGANLPKPLTSFVGRARELGELGERLATSRIVTLFGPGGAGKTRLALEYARSGAGEFADGAWFADLSPISDPDVVSARVAHSLLLQEDPQQSAEELLISYLADREALLVIDNCEHVVDAVAHLVSRLLTECPRLRVIATSRELLRVYGEAAYAVPPLSTPEGDEVAIEVATVMAHESAALFAARAELVEPDFGRRVDLHAAGQIAHICRQLEGMPLALELAAAMLACYSLGELAARLDTRIDTLNQGPRDVPRRQQTLRAAIDWSHDLLAAHDRRVFRRMAVFAGGADEAAAIAVIDAPQDASHDPTDDVGSSLRTLVARSLLLPVESEEEPRYRMLETIREYALEQLEQHGEEDSTRNLHLRWYGQTVAKAAADMRTPHQAAALDGVEREHDNVRAAFDWAVGTDPGAGAELALGLAPFWAERASLREGRSRLNALLATMPAQTAERARVQVELGNLAFRQGDVSAATGSLTQGLDSAVTLGDQATAARALLLLAAVHHHIGELDEAEPLYRRAIELLGGDTDSHTVLGCLNGLGLLAVNRNEYASARDLFGEALAALQKLGDFASAATVLGHLGYVEEVVGNSDAALRVYEEQLRTHRAGGNRTGAAFTAVRLGGLMASSNPTEAISLLEQACITGRDTGNLPLEADALGGLGQSLEKCGRFEEARAAAQRALRLHDDLGMRAQAQYDVFTLSRLAAHDGDHRSAETLVRDGIRRSLEIADRHAVAIGLGILGGLLARHDLASACQITAARTALLDAMALTEDVGTDANWLRSEEARNALSQQAPMDEETALAVARTEAR